MINFPLSKEGDGYFTHTYVVIMINESFTIESPIIRLFVRARHELSGPRNGKLLLLA